MTHLGQHVHNVAAACVRGSTQLAVTSAGVGYRLLLRTYGFPQPRKPGSEAGRSEKFNYFQFVREENSISSTSSIKHKNMNYYCSISLFPKSGSMIKILLNYF